MPSLITILAAILRAVGLASSVLSIAQSLQNLLLGKAGGVSYEQTSLNVQGGYQLLQDDTVGLHALALLIASTRSDILAAITALGSPSQVGVPVDLSGGSLTDVQASVWGTTLPDEPYNMYALMQNLSWYMAIQGQFGSWGKATSPYVAPAYWAMGVTTANFEAGYPWPDPKPGNLLIDDTLGSWLARECPTYTVAQSGDGTKQWLLSKMGAGEVIFVSALDEAQFAALKALYYPPEPVTVPGVPIWPGLGGVTLLTPVAFSDSFTVSETMQGCLIEITSAPSKQGTFSFDGLVSYRNAGAVAFLSDDGQAEVSQPLGFTTAVYLPKSMVAASSVKVRVEPGIAGTCTPFTIP